MWWMLLVACSRTDLRGTTGSQEMDAKPNGDGHQAGCQLPEILRCSVLELRNCVMQREGTLGNGLQMLREGHIMARVQFFPM